VTTRSGATGGRNAVTSTSPRQRVPPDQPRHHRTVTNIKDCRRSKPSRPVRDTRKENFRSTTRSRNPDYVALDHRCQYPQIADVLASPNVLPQHPGIGYRNPVEPLTLQNRLWLRLPLNARTESLSDRGRPHHQDRSRCSRSRIASHTSGTNDSRSETTWS